MLCVLSCGISSPSPFLTLLHLALTSLPSPLSFFPSFSLYFCLSFGPGYARGAHMPDMSFLNRPFQTARAAAVFICQALKRRAVPDTPLVRGDKQAALPLLFCLALICVTKTERESSGLPAKPDSPAAIHFLLAVILCISFFSY